MKRLVSCAVTFCLAFSMFGAPSLAFAADAVDNQGAQPYSASSSSSGDNAEGGNANGPQSDSSINVDDLKDQHGNIPQVQGTAQIFGNDDELDYDASEDDATSASREDALAAALAVQEEVVPFAVTEGNEIEGALLKVTLRTYIKNPALIDELTASLAGERTLQAKFETTDVDGTYVADFSKSDFRIPAGDYVLTIDGPDNVPFSHNVSLSNGNKTNIVIGDNQEDIFLERYGRIPYGDFDGDGKVTNKDVSALVGAVLNPASSPNYDLDGQTGLNAADLQLFAASLREGSAMQPEDAELVLATKGDDLEVTRKDASAALINAASGLSLAVNLGDNEEGVPEIADSTQVGERDFAKLLHDALLGDNASTVVLGNGTNTAINDSEDPLSIEIATGTAQGSSEDTVMMMDGMVINFPPESNVESAAPPASGWIEVEDAEGNVSEYEFGTPAPHAVQSQAAEESSSFVGAALSALSTKAYAAGAGQVEIDESNGIIKVDFQTRIAVKKITIRITETTSPDAKLVEIGKVEFLNDMEDLIAPPDLSIPSNITATPGAKRIDVSWPEEANVSGYEIMFKLGGKSVAHTTLTNSFSLREWPYSTMKDVRSGTYTVQVRSISGDWSSAWSDPVECFVPVTEKPKRVTNVTVTPGYKGLTVSWPASEDAETYTLYYKETASTGAFTKQDTGTARSFSLLNLKSGTQYTVYVTASNSIGTSGASDYATGTTYGETAVKVPWYKLINRQVQDPTNTSLNNHIESATVTYDAAQEANRGDVATTYDGRYDTGYVFGNQNGNVKYVFDQPYTMSSIVITSSIESQYGYNSNGIASVVLQGTDGAGNSFRYALADGNVSKSSTGSDAPNTYTLSFPATSVKDITINQGRYYNNKLAIAEIAFYEDDGITDRIADLWADSVRTTLKPGVTADIIQSIEDAVNTPDAQGNDEYTPHKELYLKELAEARSVLEGLADFRQPRYYDNSINRIGSQPVGGINGWQPLGVAACEDDELKLYIGGVNNANGQVANLGVGTGLKLIICQYNSTPERVSTTLVDNLRTGENTVKIPTQLTSLLAEHGGQLYIDYTSTNDFTFGIRVLGGEDIAVLDLHGITGTADEINAERMSRINEYVTELAAQCEAANERHDKHSEMFKAYNASTCVANTTDIVLDDMMYSIPASQAYAGISGAADKAATLNTSLKTMEYMMKLFYQHKGLTDDMGSVTKYGTNNALPTGHLNIRLMRMKEGVFMYAAGNHIGIPFGSTNLTGLRTVEPDSMGKDVDATMFGWGIAHEIGHEINQSCYTVVEVTNNYYSQLSTNKNPPSTSRYTNASVYNKVTSGTYGPLSGKTGIGCYWQLHLAYDNYYNYKTFDSYEEQMDNLIFARMDAYARNPQSAPGNLTLSGGTNNCLARLACAATQKDLTDYFDAWGLKLDATTKAYASQFEKETRPIQYVNDDAQAYRIQNGSATAGSTEVSAELYAVEDGQPVKVEGAKQVHTRELQLKVSQSGGDQSGLIGYEILRNGKAVAFQEISNNANVDSNGVLTYTDKITTENNRAYVYSVRAVDKLLNVSEAVELPQVKLVDDGAIADKSRWTATTNLVSQDDQTVDYGTWGSDVNTDSGEGLDLGLDSDSSMPCEDEKTVAAIDKLIDGDYSTQYTGSLPSNGSVSDSEGNAVDNAAPYIEIDFGSEKQITAIKVPTADAEVVRQSTLTVSNSVNDETGEAAWVTVNKGTAVPNAADETVTFYFDEKDDPQLKVYKASKIRLTGTLNENKTGGMTLHEIDLIGVTGDNADFLEEGAVGRLETSVVYAPEATPGENTIPTGALVFIGSYKGDTAYNAFKMYDQKGRLVPGTQVFFAEPPGEGRSLGTTADGRWIWYMTDADIAEYESSYKCNIKDMTSVRLELYRVDDALTLANERHVADTMTMQLDWDKVNSTQIQLQISSDFNDLKTGDEIKSSAGQN